MSNFVMDGPGHTPSQTNVVFPPLIQPSESVPNLIPGLDKYLYHWDGSRLQVATSQL